MAVTINEGTQTDIYTKLNAGTEIQVVKLDIGSGTAIADFGGTINRVTELLKGTVTSVGTVVGLGSISDIGTAKEVTTVANVTNGSINVLSGTIENIGSVVGLGGTSLVVLDSGGTVSEVTNLASGTLDEILTVGTLGSISNIAVIHNAGTIAALPDPLGSVVVTAGTVTTSMGDLSGGTLDELTHIGSIDVIGTMPAIAVGESTGGTLDILTGVGTLGSISNIAVVHNAGTIAALPDPLGSVVVTAGTVSAIGADLPGGTVDLVTGVGTLGSISNVAVIHNAGTVQSVSNIVTGTLASVTLNPKYTGSQILIAHALGTTGGTVIGTLSAASGAGTYHYVSGLQIVVGAGTTDVFLGFGTTTTGGSVLARGIFTPGGGIMRDFTFPIRSVGTNSEICYIIAGAGTASVAVNYWKGV